METKQPQTSPAQTRENIMGTMEINPLLVKLSVPMMISMLVQALYNVVDSIYVSQVSESAVTALSLAFPVQNLLIGFAVGIGVGVNSLLSKSLGEKNQEAANRAAGNGIVLMIVSLYYLLFGFALSRLVYASFANGVFDKYLNPHIEGAQVGQGLRPQSEDDELPDEDDEDEEDE